MDESLSVRHPDAGWILKYAQTAFSLSIALQALRHGHPVKFTM
ncbi:MAG: hypothetical protein ACI8XO_001045 [Verrucomicrobiales bacterium]|jgi:hypothetical protein